jgi:hypothetical protein
MQPNPSKQNKVRPMSQVFTASLGRIVNRVRAAKLAAKQLLGIVPEGISHRSLCPKGAGHVNVAKKHTFANQHLIGSRKAQHRSRIFLRRIKYTAATLSTAR